MYQKLTDGHCLSDYIEDKEIFPVGGTFRGNLNTYLIVDAGTLSSFFERTAKNAEIIEQNQGLQEWFSKLKTDLDYSLFCHIYAFNATMKQAFPDIKKNATQRAKFYDKQGKRSLSEAVAQKMCACTEYTLLAQLYFQSQNIPTRYVGGELAPNGDFNAVEPHSFIAFQNKDKQYVFDPANPLEGQRPRIAEFIGSKENEYLQTKCLFNNDKWYYSGGSKGAFLCELPSQKTLMERLKKGSTKEIKIKKEKENG
ncbi:MAG: hypothetical protein J6T55_04185 [Alphaproteobacteria bacterium]|nr:hypothetical protein [Alphaproteobacteria bacterium]